MRIPGIKSKIRCDFCNRIIKHTIKRFAYKDYKLDGNCKYCSSSEIKIAMRYYWNVDNLVLSKALAHTEITFDRDKDNYKIYYLPASNLTSLVITNLKTYHISEIKLIGKIFTPNNLEKKLKIVLMLL